jgi:predicted metalloprotease with PDZ domain
MALPVATATASTKLFIDAHPHVMTRLTATPRNALRLPFLPLHALLLACALLAGPPAARAQAQGADLVAELYPGTIALFVDATDLSQRVLRVRQTLPVRPGPLKLFFPRWIPGHHSPTGDITRLAGLKISAPDGKPMAWSRDPLDTHAFRLTVPHGVSQLDIDFQHLSPVARDGGRVVVTREMLNLQWHNLVLYPAGYEARSISVQASLRLPPQWTQGSALVVAGQDQGVLQFKPVSLETLVDSPIFAGRHFRRVELDTPNSPRPVTLNIVADRAEQLKASDVQLAAHRQLVQQADKLFTARHFAKYDFLLALSEDLGGIGLEHHESSENGVRPNYFENWDKDMGERDLLPHEYVHSWNGKFRRPRDLATPHFNTPMQNTLLWLYEGQTQYWGKVLAARSALVSAELARDDLAQIAAAYENRSGRTWRNLQDTTNEPIMGNRNWRRDWRSWQRGADYYNEAVLVWLDADTLIREKSGGKRSLDDFARLFFGLRDGDLGPLPYSFDDVVKTLNEVQWHDWARFLRERLDSNTAAPLDGLARAGWKLAYTDTPSDNFKAGETEGKYSDFSYSLGLRAGSEGRLLDVMWDSPAFRAGLSPAMTLVAVNWRAYKPEVLKEAITANKDGQAPIDVLVREGDAFRAVRIDYRSGLRYPKLERVAGSDDRLAAVLAAR